MTYPLPKCPNWCFTEYDAAADARALELPESARYLCYGRETCPTTGRVHYQGVVIWKIPQRLSACKKWLPTAHWEVCKGSLDQNQVYCKKDGDWTELGDPPKSKGDGNKRRWDEAREAAKRGDFEAIPSDIYIRCKRACHEIAFDNHKVPESMPTTTGEWWYGDTGTGKSRTARELYPDAYMKACNKWWDGYKGEKYVIIDDFDIDHKGLCHHLKIWGDHYPFLAEVKGATMMIRPEKIIVTSNYHPAVIWEKTEDNGPIQRRYPVKMF